MARFIDLTDDVGSNEQLAERILSLERDAAVAKLMRQPADPDAAPVESQSTPSLRAASSPPPVSTQNAMTRALSCYPIVAALVSYIDLTTLDYLSRTNHHIRNSLLDSRNSLRRSTLHCSNEQPPLDKEEAELYWAPSGDWFSTEDRRNSNGIADCPRDLVAACRRCSQIVCRNCTIKPPAPVLLRDRHRRLCTPCTRAPISTLAKPSYDPSLPFNAELAHQSVCHCAESVWLCKPCGKAIRSADNEYRRLWRWRNHYGEVLGGLGTGIGDGDRGVICGREVDCCAAKEREQEVDCDAEIGRENPSSSWDSLLSSSPSTSNPSTPAAHTSHNPLDQILDDVRHERTPSPQLRTGYERHEIEGIGGVVKRKLTKMVRVGACVPEWEDERVAGMRLQREIKGELRSWCGWCWRVIPGEADKAVKD